MTSNKTSPSVTGFAPTARGAHIHTLLLGSAPSVASLKHQQYYGHPQNHFWVIMGDCLAAGLDLPYAARTQRLAEQGIAVWDVLLNCIRPGSLDSAISQIEVNDFTGYFSTCPNLLRVGFNGRFAETTFRRHASPTLPNHVQLHYLPSTSPANAGTPYAKKLALWRAFLLST